MDSVHLQWSSGRSVLCVWKLTIFESVIWCFVCSTDNTDVADNNCTMTRCVYENRLRDSDACSMHCTYTHLNSDFIHLFFLFSNQWKDRWIKSERKNEKKALIDFPRFCISSMVAAAATTKTMVCLFNHP